jgi:predicted Zn-dependent protease
MARNRVSKRRGNSIGLMFAAAVVAVPVVALAIERINFTPGFNLFSPKQDIKIGEQNAEQADKQLPILHDAEVEDYVNHLGKYLAGFAPNKPQGFSYPWTFKVVNSRDINAFALPGGFIYVNRGAIEAAADEAQIAGVMAHEEGHVAMRHGTHEASEAMPFQIGLALFGGFLGSSSSVGSQLAQLGLSFGVNSFLLKNSRTAESQADSVGTYILYNAGYDPHAMAQFFETIEKKYPQQTIEFLSDHPNPGNRVKAVDDEIPLLGPPRVWKTDSPDFEAVKQKLLAMPAPPKPKPAPANQ